MKEPIPPWKTRAATFSQFMQWCLYDPAIGYYRSPGKVFGKHGDFYTSPYTHRLFAELLASFTADFLDTLGGGPLQLVELGAGEGLLGRQITTSLSERRPDLFARLVYTPLDLNNPQLPPSIRGLVFSNEFFDAQPVHRVRIRDSRPREIFVLWRDGRFSEVEGEPSDPRIEEFMRVGFPHWEEDAVYEVNLAMLDWLARLDRRIEQAAVVTIDYGYDASAYRARSRPEGTLLCYRRHQAHNDPYIDIGRQDITCHVCFEAFLAKTRALGWRDRPLQTQREFLVDQGLTRILLAEEAQGLFNMDRLDDRLGLKRLLEPGGISDALSVLVNEVRL